MWGENVEGREETEMHGEDGCQGNSVESYMSAASTEAGRRLADETTRPPRMQAQSACVRMNPTGC